MAKTLRVGIVGLGGICRNRHVPGLNRIEDVEIAAVANRSRESGERAAKEYNIPDVHDDWEELVRRDDLDIVLIGTYPNMHKPVSCAALESGKHVFCQARMARDAEEAREMLEAAQRHPDLVAGLCPVPIGMPVDAVVKRLVRENTLGEVRLARVQSFSHAFASPDAPMNWRKDHRLSGHNMLTLGMYAEVLHRWFGWTRRLQALTQIFVPERTDESGERVQVRIPDQALFNTEMDQCPAVQYVMAAAVPHGSDRVEIYGSKAALRYEVKGHGLFMAQNGGEFEPVEPRPEEVYNLKQWDVEERFIDAVREGKPYHPDFLEGLKYMEVVQAVHDAAETGKTIELSA
jgi:predicted dehydrogenase